ncbi:MAG TPA: TraR/DksA C4-type zinc finger protein [Myxococcota bacterium]|jgi:DnaK suppressor protein|nr:TraR/DksA C4-type zinc finger protein [Myxococcota bacterium]
MSPEEIQTIREILTADRERMMRAADDERGELRDRERADVGDSLDESLEESIASTQLRLRDREKWLLEKIDQALGRIVAGTFGLCEECEEEIGFARLKARPVATLCIECKEAEERAERTRTDPRTLEADEGGGSIE